MVGVDAPFLCSNWGKQTFTRSQIFAVGTTEKKTTMKERKDKKQSALVHSRSVPAAIIENDAYFEPITNILEENNERESEHEEEECDDNEAQDGGETAQTKAMAEEPIRQKRKRMRKEAKVAGQKGLYAV